MYKGKNIGHTIKYNIKHCIQYIIYKIIKFLFNYTDKSYFGNVTCFNTLDGISGKGNKFYFIYKTPYSINSCEFITNIK